MTNHFPIVLSFVVLLHSALFTRALSGNIGLTALNDSSHSVTLYRQLRNGGAPSESDPAVRDARVRKRICEELANSGFFPITDADVYQDLLLPKYSPLLRYLYYSADSLNYVYENPFTQQEIVEGESNNRAIEHVFVCLSRDWVYGEIRPFFVSKEYNVGPVGQPYNKPGRFVFTGLELERHPQYNYMLLAEEPSSVHLQPEFNVELYFLRMRKYIQKANRNDIDPLCKLISDDNVDANNQHYRFCVVVSRSLYFKHFLQYPMQESYGCSLVEISFRTPEAIRLAAGRTYYERLTRCFSKSCSDENESFFYVSRAYRSNGVLVYLYDFSDEKVYLENLSTNVAIVDELNSFDLVEY